MQNEMSTKKEAKERQTERERETPKNLQFEQINFGLGKSHFGVGLENSGVRTSIKDYKRKKNRLGATLGQ